MKYISAFLFILCCVLGRHTAFAQKNRVSPVTQPSIDNSSSSSSFRHIFIGHENTLESLEKYLSSAISNLKEKEVSLKLVSRKESPGGVHFTFEQYYRGIKIFRSQVKVNMDKNGNIKSVFDHSFKPCETDADSAPGEMIWGAGITGIIKKEKVFFPEKERFIHALKLEVAEGDEYYEIIFDSKGNAIYRNDLLRYVSRGIPDSTVSGTVFLPDPLTTAGVTYGAPYTDNNDADATEINSQRAQVYFKATYDGSASLFRLESPYVKITEHSNPSIIPVTSINPDFSFTRAQSGFEDVNVFYHISSFHAYIQSLGFTSLVNYQINADSHALNGQDNSNYNGSSNPPKLNFGEGGVDDAEDADVIIHEYGHAISDDASPNTNFGTERNALDEALGDYLASSYSRSINPFKWENVFSWDGHNEFWDGRSSVSTDHYPEDRQNDLYEDADIWSSTMMEIWEDIGRENADAIQLQALYGYATGMNMTDAARLVIQADSMLNNGTYYDAICNRFYNRGLVAFCGNAIGETSGSGNTIRLFNTQNFAIGNGYAILRFGKPAPASLSLSDISGKCIFQKESDFDSEVFIDGSKLERGVYFLTVFSEGFTRNFKLLKL